MSRLKFGRKLNSKWSAFRVVCTHLNRKRLRDFDHQSRWPPKQHMLCIYVGYDGVEQLSFNIFNVLQHFTCVLPKLNEWVALLAGDGLCSYCPFRHAHLHKYIPTHKHPDLFIIHWVCIVVNIHRLNELIIVWCLNFLFHFAVLRCKNWNVSHGNCATNWYYC